MLIAHISDPHILHGLTSLRYLRNLKQILGLFNWYLKRRKIHQRHKLENTVKEILAKKANVVIVTGDICQLAFANDYLEFARIMQPLKEAGIPVIILQGNHDHYVKSVKSKKAFHKLKIELLCQKVAVENDVYSIQDVDFLAIDGAVPTPPFQCWGLVSEEQLANLRNDFSELDSKKTRVAFGHFPLLNSKNLPLPKGMALQNADKILEILQEHKVKAYLCGHIHKAFESTLPGNIKQFCSGSITSYGVLRFLEINGLGIEQKEVFTPQD